MQITNKRRCIMPTHQRDELIGVGVPFDRIRRITGYLTSDIRRWNNAKRHEEHERVKHAQHSQCCH